MAKNAKDLTFWLFSRLVKKVLNNCLRIVRAKTCIRYSYPTKKAEHNINKEESTNTHTHTHTHKKNTNQTKILTFQGHRRAVLSASFSFWCRCQIHSFSILQHAQVHTSIKPPRSYNVIEIKPTPLILFGYWVVEISCIAAIVSLWLCSREIFWRELIFARVDRPNWGFVPSWNACILLCSVIVNLGGNCTSCGTRKASNWLAEDGVEFNTRVKHGSRIIWQQDLISKLVGKLVFFVKQSNTGTKKDPEKAAVWWCWWEVGTPIKRCLSIPNVSTQNTQTNI